MFHQVNILSIYSNHLWSKNITISTACLRTHWTAHIKMYYFQQVAFLFHLTKNEAFQSSCPCGMICMSQVIQNQVSPNDPSVWSFFMHYTNRHGSHVSIFSKTSESKDPSTWSFFMRFIPIWLTWQCHKYVVLSLLSYIFWHEHVYHYDRDSINYSF